MQSLKILKKMQSLSKESEKQAQVSKESQKFKRPNGGIAETEVCKVGVRIWEDLGIKNYITRTSAYLN